MDLKDMDQDELESLAGDVSAELARRRDAQNAPKAMKAMALNYQRSVGREDGQPWGQYHDPADLYMDGDTVTHKGKSYVSRMDWNHREPGTPGSGWHETVGDGEQPPEWEQRYGHETYMEGDRVTFEGEIYKSNMDNNSWSPSEHPAGWDKQ